MLEFLAQNGGPKVDINLPANVPPDAIVWIVFGLGILLLLYGRSLYWAFIAIAGFLLGMQLANEYLADKDQWIRILVAIGAGILGAILGILIQRLAFAIGGFFAGSYLAVALASRLHPGGDTHIWAIIGGIIGAIVAAFLMDWAIIVLSSLAGATAILAPFQSKLDDRLHAVAFIVLAAIGIVFQSRRMSPRPTVPPPAAPTAGP
jgi:hypothetical protein